MKKNLLGILIFLLLFVAGCVLFYQPKKKLEIHKPELREKNHVIVGRVQDASMNLVTIKTHKGSIYSFSLAYVEPNLIKGLKQDGKIKVNYYGILDTGKSVQTGTVKKIEEVKETLEQYPDSWNDQGIFKEYYELAYQKLQTMRLDEKISQLLLVRIPNSNQVETVKNYQFGGYILFGRDTNGKTKEELIQNIKSYQNVSKIPLIIATDEEGGIVNRISTNPNLASTPFLSSQELYQQGGYDLIKEDTKKKSNLLSSLGINMNLAPVADVSTNENDYMYDRSFGLDATKTAEYIKTVVEASKNSMVAYTLKHFPGYGNNKDTHTGMAIDNRSYDTFAQSDFIPFLSGIQNGVPAVLVSHNIINAIEEDIPASLSKNIHNILREQLRFTGIAMTDDLAMDAVFDYVDKPAIKAIQAGNDMIIISDYKKGIADIKSGLETNEITEDMIDHLVFRVLAYKYYMKLL